MFQKTFRQALITCHQIQSLILLFILLLIKSVTIKSRLKGFIYILSTYHPTSFQFGTISKPSHLFYSMLSMRSIVKRFSLSLALIKKFENFNKAILDIFGDYCPSKVINILHGYRIKSKICYRNKNHSANDKCKFMSNCLFFLNKKQGKGFL